MTASAMPVVLTVQRIEHAVSCAKSSRNMPPSLRHACAALPFAKIGEVTGEIAAWQLHDGETTLIDADIYELKEAWQATRGAVLMEMRNAAGDTRSR